MKHIFIINPTAGKTDSRQKIYDMAESLRQKHGLDVQCILTKKQGHATELAKKLCETGEALRFYACGGATLRLPRAMPPPSRPVPRVDHGRQHMGPRARGGQHRRRRRHRQRADVPTMQPRRRQPAAALRPGREAIERRLVVSGEGPENL